MPKQSNHDQDKIKARRKRNQPKTEKALEGRRRRAKARYQRLAERAKAGDVEAARLAGWKQREQDGENPAPINSSSTN